MSRGGRQVELRRGDLLASVTEVGAGLRLLRHGTRDLVLGYAEDVVRPKFRGALLAPWPNRVVDGRYELAGTAYQLDLTEPERLHALHGLVAWERFAVVDEASDAVTLRHAIVPRPGYPFELEVSATYALDDDGMTCTVSARNTGDDPAPYGTGPHPYLVAGPGRVDAWKLTLPASTVLEVTGERLLPGGLAEVAGGPFDFRDGRTIGTTELDHAFTGLVPDREGRVRVSLLDEEGGVEVVWDPTVLPWVQVHTADLPDPAVSRLGLAVEPMTCPPDAFNSGTDLVVLEPGEGHTASWRINPL
jgi:aldose 1-epimerase